MDLGKLTRISGYILGFGTIFLGVILVAVSKTADEQTAGTLAAIFGLLVVWFMAWLGRG